VHKTYDKLITAQKILFLRWAFLCNRISCYSRISPPLKHPVSLQPSPSTIWWYAKWR